MKTITFTIKGNQENPDGNPIPYLRTTQRSQWTDKARRYNAWKDYVRANYLDAIEKIPRIKIDDYGETHNILQRKPIPKTKNKIHMKIDIVWGNKAHGDGDNIFKGIADALFMDDKYISGEFDYKYGEQPKVKVEITFYGLEKIKNE